eukprot:1149228-Pelagomonas_calceolata.AAC.2
MVEFQGLAALSIKSSTDDSSHPNHIPVVAWLPALLSPELRQLSTQSLFGRGVVHVFGGTRECNGMIILSFEEDVCEKGHCHEKDDCEWEKTFRHRDSNPGPAGFLHEGLRAAYTDHLYDSG